MQVDAGTVHGVFQIRFRSQIKRFGLHGLDIFGVHPLQLGEIENGRRFGDPLQIERIHKAGEVEKLLLAAGLQPSSAT